jgi:hypothetical protein
MLTPRFFVRLTYVTVFVAAAAACTTTKPSADDIAMQRAYGGGKVAVTGSRIHRQVDPRTGLPNSGVTSRTIEGDAARAMLRTMPSSSMEAQH